MSETIILAIISGLFTLAGTIATVLSSASRTRKEQATKIDAVEKKLDEHIRESEWAEAKQKRIRILRFNDDICRGVEYSENHYEEILEDIDQYEAFCDAHEDYKNNKGTMAMAHIKDEYAKRKAENNFL